MEFSQEVINSVIDGDLHVTLEQVEYSTNSRTIVPVGYMMENHVKEE
ncbi:hypothetical protein [Cytobacillus horneckiae]|nr:hypothetical protein [Cytobacillus horneckiae]MCM3179715.1 hypothetical protein [Cytobacillus horneckiae]